MLHTRTLVAAIALCAVAATTAFAQDWPSRRYRRDGVQIRLGQNYHLPADQVVSWPIIIVFASATLDGRVEDDVVVIGGSVRIGPTAQIRGDVTALGGGVQIADTAEVTGEISDVSVIWPEIRWAIAEWFWPDRTGWAVLGLIGTLLRMTLVLMAACVLALVAPGWIRRVERQVASAALASGFVGLATELLFVPLLLMVIIGLIITIVGIPLLALVPFALVAFAVTWVAGFAGAASWIGGRMRAGGSAYAAPSPVVDVFVGVMTLFAFTLAGNVLALAPSFMAPLAVAFGAAGIVVEYVAWTVGLGAVLLAPLRSRWGASPPPIPSPVSTPATA